MFLSIMRNLWTSSSILSNFDFENHATNNTEGTSSQMTGQTFDTYKCIRTGLENAMSKPYVGKKPEFKGKQLL